ncbi:MAG TPA: hypothetical protein VEF36_00920 [Roseiarcus sp.]|nr:hypothetical protein [Roseiarcus sp.]
MSLLRALRRHWAAPAGAACFGCRHFVNEWRAIEAAMPGLASLSSGHASVRADDGLCLKHAIYLNGRRACAEREPASAPPPECDAPG